MANVTVATAMKAGLHLQFSHHRLEGSAVQHLAYCQIINFKETIFGKHTFKYSVI